MAKKKATKRETKKQRAIRQKKIMRYLAKPGYVGRMILIPATNILASTQFSSAEKLVYGEIYTIFNTTDRFQLNKQLLLRPINKKHEAIKYVTSALHKLAHLGLVKIVPVYDNYQIKYKTRKNKKTKKVIGYIIINTGLNKLSAVKMAKAKPVKSDKEASKQKRLAKQPYTKVAHKVIEYLNKKTGKARRFTKTNEKHIIGREHDGYKLSDFKKVIDNKYRDWGGTPWAKYLRPATLFIPSHFEDYLLENGSNAKQTNSNSSSSTSKSGEDDYFGLKF